MNPGEAGNGSWPRGPPVAKIEGAHTDPDEDLSGLGLGDVLADEIESLNAGEPRMTVGTQRVYFLDYGCT